MFVDIEIRYNCKSKEFTGNNVLKIINSGRLIIAHTNLGLKTLNNYISIKELHKPIYIDYNTYKKIYNNISSKNIVILSGGYND